VQEGEQDSSVSAVLGERFQNALVYAVRLHANQSRKGTSVPYVAHLLSVSALVLEDGGDEDQAIAALLHDAVEDQGGLPTLAEINQRFGPRVASIVEGLTDTYETPKPPWRARKEQYIEHLQSAPLEVRRVSLADKVHNARSTLADLRQNGQSTWDIFRGGKEGSLWYYQTLVEFFAHSTPGYLAEELARVIAEIKRLTPPAE
jgi:(p)ppGpp synthase/HD superfamily hydrolase